MPDPIEPRILRVAGSDGVKLNLLEWSRQGVPLLLLHGFGNEAHIWDDLAPVIAPYYRVLALDLRGHGDSDWHPDGRYDYDDHVADLDALIEGLEFDRLVIVAHSLGGRIAMLWGGLHPEKLAGLAIVDSAPELDRRGSVRIALDVAQQREPSFDSPAEYERQLARAYPAARPAALRRMALHGVRQREDGRFALKMDPALRAAASRADDARALARASEQRRDEMWRSLERIACPTLVVRGAASDVLSPETAERMADDALPDGRLAVVAQASHSVMIDNPEGFEQALCRFVLGE